MLHIRIYEKIYLMWEMDYVFFYIKSNKLSFSTKYYCFPFSRYVNKKKILMNKFVANLWGTLLRKTKSKRKRYGSCMGKFKGKHYRVLYKRI